MLLSTWKLFASLYTGPFTGITDRNANENIHVHVQANELACILITGHPCCLTLLHCMAVRFWFLLAVFPIVILWRASVIVIFDVSGKTTKRIIGEEKLNRNENLLVCFFHIRNKLSTVPLHQNSIIITMKRFLCYR